MSFIKSNYNTILANAKSKTVPNTAAKERVERAKQQEANLNSKKEFYGSIAMAPTFQERTLKQVNTFLNKCNVNFKF